ncbi:MAG: hypothetical protein JKX87_07905 [Cycloclasticus sp.]|nr:hypothetical protein [Cycloclasticus sp.]
MKFSKFWLVLILSALITGCGSDPEALTVSKVQRVTNFDFTLNEIPAVSIAIGPNTENHFDITLYRSNIKSGYAVSSKSKSNSTIAIEATWSGKSFVQSSKHSTGASVQIVSIDTHGRVAILKISAILVNPETGELLQLSNSQVTISGENFINLTKA